MPQELNYYPLDDNEMKSLNEQGMLTDEYILQNKKRIQWSWLAKYKTLSDLVLWQGAEYISVIDNATGNVTDTSVTSDSFAFWSCISRYQNDLSEEFLREYFSKLSWGRILYYESYGCSNEIVKDICGQTSEEYWSEWVN